MSRKSIRKTRVNFVQLKTAEKILLGIGILAFVYVSLKMPWEPIALAVRGVGCGFFLIFFQEIVSHIFNTLGWQVAFLPEHRQMVPSFWRLLRVRIAGDAVGYLIPSALVAGELAKATMIGDRHPLASRLSSLVVAKFTQMIAFALITVGSLFLIAQGKVSFGTIENPLGAAFTLLGVILLILFGLKVRAGWGDKAEAGQEELSQGWRGTLKMLDKGTMTFLRKHPALFLLSILCFAAAYLWGIFEAYWIARFMGMPISVETAMFIELLSISVDGILFMVPAKAGTQELSKTAIFAALRLPKAAGFTFGLIRHIREILWALVGLALFYRMRRGDPERSQVLAE